MAKNTAPKTFLHDKKWWIDLFGNFLGALLGIIVTFGTSAYIESRSKQEMARKILLITIGDIDRSIHNMQAICDDMLQMDSCFRQVLGHAPDRIGELPDSVLVDFIRNFTDNRVYPMDASAERIFTQNMDIWRTIDDITLQQRIGNCFADCDTFYDIHAEWNEQRKKLAWKVVSLGERFDAGHAAAVRAMMETPEIRSFVRRHNYYATYLNAVVPFIKDENRYNKRDVAVTKADLEQFFAVDAEEYEPTDVDES